MAKRTTKKMNLPINEALGSILGAVASTYASSIARKMLPTLPGAISSAIPLALGVFLANNKNNLVKGVGFGMIAAGGSDIAKGLLHGISAPNEIDELFTNDDDFLSLPSDQSILSEPADQYILSEMFEEDAEEMMLSAFDEENEEM